MHSRQSERILLFGRMPLSWLNPQQKNDYDSPPDLQTEPALGTLGRWAMVVWLLVVSVFFFPQFVPILNTALKVAKLRLGIP